MPIAEADGRHRVVIERVSPEVDCGRFPIKRVMGEMVVVEADVFADGHEQIDCQILFWHEGNVEQKAPMQSLGNDRWRGSFRVTELGRYGYTVEGWADRFQTWRSELRKRVTAGQDVRIELLIGAKLIEEAAARSTGEDASILRDWALRIRGANEHGVTGTESGSAVALEERGFEVIQRYPDRQFASRYEKPLAVTVDREKAKFSTWYEVFPRSCSPEAGHHGSFRDCEAWIPYIASMGFDVVYFPPIHPIGRSFRKGKNNSTDALPSDVGSPWAIGAAEGGHKSIHAELGAPEDFRRLVAKAREHGLEVALDIALQCAPDHPYVKEHREWFRARPDGTIQYAENPPKKYQDIYPLDFENANWRGLWNELKSIVEFWIGHGVHIFRVDNPHTKSFGFWEWAINEIKQLHPDALFLAEAFTRPQVMYWLAKSGFSQSYTYFTWRNTKQELTEYFTQLTQTNVREYFRPNLWPNTPDILPEFLQIGGRAAFMVRLILAS